MHIDTIRTMGRAAQGVKLINLKKGGEIAAVAKVPRSDEEDDEFENEENNSPENENGTEVENNSEE